MHLSGLLLLVSLLVLANAGSALAKKSKDTVKSSKHALINNYFYFFFKFNIKKKNLWTDEERDEFISAFNRHRSEVSNPPAAHMSSLVWDTYIEEQAQKIADKCNCVHSELTERLYKNGEEMEEHIWAGNWVPPPTHVVDRWAATKENYTYSNSEYNLYTQIVWNGTYRVGCAKKTCSQLSGTKWSPGTIVVCNYYPRGNVHGEYPYAKQGSPVATDTCATHSAECGTFKNNMSATVSCNSCYGNEVCTWDNRCLCIPKTCDEYGYSCGVINNGCDLNNISCGKCGGDSECRDYRCFVYERYRTVLLYFNSTYILDKKESLVNQLGILAGEDNIENITYNISADSREFTAYVLAKDVKTAHNLYNKIKKNKNLEQPISERHKVELMDIYYSGKIEPGYGGVIGIILVVAYFVALVAGLAYFIKKGKEKQKADEFKSKIDKLDNDLEY